MSLARVMSVFALAVIGESTDAQLPEDSPEALVQKFYDEYPDELEGGLPRGEDLEWISTFVSNRLYVRFRSALAYQDEWIKRHPDRPPYYLKPPFADGVHFTGVPDAIHSFKVVDSRSQTPRTWLVRIRFWIDPKAEGWDALVVVKEQRTRFVIDDIIFLPAEPGDTSWTLSEALEWRQSE